MFFLNKYKEYTFSDLYLSQRIQNNKQIYYTTKKALSQPRQPERFVFLYYEDTFKF